MTLSEATPRRPVTVVNVAVDPSDRRRLAELGVRRGSTIEVLRRAPFGGPLAVRVAGGRFALRIEDTDRVAVTVSDATADGSEHV